MNMIRNQTAEDITIIKTKYILKTCTSKYKAQLLPFSRKEYLENGTSVKDGLIYFKEGVAKVSDILSKAF